MPSKDYYALPDQKALMSSASNIILKKYGVTEVTP